MPEKPIIKLPNIPFVATLAFALVSLVAIGYLLHLGQMILAPFFLAFLISMLFLPFANLLENKLKFGRGLSSITAVFIMLLILCGLGYFFGSQLSDFSNDIPMLEKQFNVVFHQLQSWISSSFHVNTEKQFAYINNGLEKLLSSSGMILSFTLGLFSTGLGFFFFFILFFVFILNYRRILYQFIINVFSDSHQAKVREVVNEVQQMTKKYIIGLCIQIVIVSALTMLMLSLIGVKYALLLGVLTGLLNVIPYIGVFSSMLFAMLIAFATGAPVTSLYVLIGYIVMHTIDGNIVLPFVVGSKVKINALFSFIGILVGEHLWGISGMFLCIPALAIIKIVFERIDSLRPWGQVLGEGSDSEDK